MASIVFTANGSVADNGNPLGSRPLNARGKIVENASSITVPEDYTYRVFYYNTTLDFSQATLIKHTDWQVGTYTTDEPTAAGILLDTKHVDEVSTPDVSVLNAQSSYTPAGEEPPVDPPVSVVSAQNGNWEDTTTWVGGVVPADVSNVIIDAGHIVTNVPTHQRDGNMTIKGTLNIPVDSIVTHGVREGSKPTLLFDGGTLTGAGQYRVQNGAVISSKEKWSFVTGSVSLNYSGLYDSITWDLEKFSWQSSGALNIRFRTEVSNTGTTFNVKNSCFVGGTVMIGAEGSSLKSAITIENCTFYDVTTLTLTGSGASKLITLSNCSLNESFIQLYDAVIDNCYVYNCNNMQFGGDNVKVQNCFTTYYKPEEDGKFLIGTNSSGSTTVSSNIIYGVKGGTVNSRISTVENVTGNFFEIYDAGGGNGIICTDRYTNNFINNIYIGYGSAVTNLLSSDVPFTAVITGNTCYYMTPNSTDALYCFEYFANTGLTYTGRNNLHVFAEGLEGPSVTYARGFGDPQPVGAITIDVDYSAKHNVTNWFLPIFTNTTGGNLIDADPKFIDSSRSVLSWASRFGITTDAELISYFIALNGFDTVTGTHSEISKSVSFSEARDWLIEGYTPTNMALATAGEGGTFVGAVEPKEIIVVTANISLKANTNTVTIGDTITYTLTLSEALPEDLLVTTSIGNVSRSTTISANALEGYITFTTATVGNLVAQIKTTDNGNVTIKDQIVNVVVNDVAPPPPQGKFFRPLDVSTVDESHVNLTVPSGVAGELMITLTYTRS